LQAKKLTQVRDRDRVHAIGRSAERAMVRQRSIFSVIDRVQSSQALPNGPSLLAACHPTGGQAGRSFETLLKPASRSSITVRRGFLYCTLLICAQLCRHQIINPAEKFCKYVLRGRTSLFNIWVISSRSLLTPGAVLRRTCRKKDASHHRHNQVIQQS